MTVKKVLAMHMSGVVGLLFSSALLAEPEQDSYQTEEFSGQFVESLIAGSKSSGLVVVAPDNGFKDVAASGYVDLSQCSVKKGSSSMAIVHDGGSPVSDGILISTDAKALRACGESGCGKSITVKDDAPTEFEIGKTKIAMNFFGRVCHGSGEVYIPGWYIDRLRRHQGANPGMSDRLLFMNAGDWIEVIDLKKNDRFFSIKDSSAQKVVRKLGTLRSVIADKGGFHLIHDRGYLRIDFVRDFAFAVTGKQTFTRVRLGSGNVDSWLESDITEADSDVGRPVGADDDLVLFGQGAVKYVFRFDQAKPDVSFTRIRKGHLVAAIVNGEGKQRVVSAVANDGGQLVRQTFDGSVWKHVDLQTAEGVSGESDYDKVLVAGATGLVFSKDGKRLTNVETGATFNASHMAEVVPVSGQKFFVALASSGGGSGGNCVIMQTEVRREALVSKSVGQGPCSASAQGYSRTSAGDGHTESVAIVDAKFIRVYSRSVK